MDKALIRQAEDSMKKAIDATKREFSELRTGRANPKMVEGMKVECYGSFMLLKEVASISVPEARLITIHPWDPTIIPAIEKSILQSNLGLTPFNDGKIVRLSVPPLSEERREEMVKIVKKIAEEGRVSLRTIRKEHNEKIRTLEKDKKISEDDRFRTEAEIQKLTDKYIREVDQLLQDKEKELKEF